MPTMSSWYPRPRCISIRGHSPTMMKARRALMISSICSHVQLPPHTYSGPKYKVPSTLSTARQPNASTWATPSTPMSPTATSITTRWVQWLTSLSALSNYPLPCTWWVATIPWSKKQTSTTTATITSHWLSSNAYRCTIICLLITLWVQWLLWLGCSLMQHWTVEH